MPDRMEITPYEKRFLRWASKFGLVERKCGELAVKHFLRPGEVADIYLVTARSVGNWAESGAIPNITTPGGHHRFMPAGFLMMPSSS